MSCKKYKIQKWLHGKTVVYTPMIKEYFLWWDMEVGNEWHLSYFDGRGFCKTEEAARKVIEVYKKELADQEVFERDCELAKCRFNKKDSVIRVD